MGPWNKCQVCSTKPGIRNGEAECDEEAVFLRAFQQNGRCSSLWRSCSSDFWQHEKFQQIGSFRFQCCLLPVLQHFEKQLNFCNFSTFFSWRHRHDKSNKSMAQQYQGRIHWWLCPPGPRNCCANKTNQRIKIRITRERTLTIRPIASTQRRTLCSSCATTVRTALTWRFAVSKSFSKFWWNSIWYFDSYRYLATFDF